MQTSLENLYNKEYFENGGKSGYKNYNKGLNYFKHRLRDYQRALHLVVNFHPQRVLDLGCAFGYLVAALRTFGIEAYGVDVSTYAVSNAPRKIRPFLYATPISKLPFPNKFFDLVVSYDVLEHIPHSQITEVLKEAKRVCSENIFFEIYTDKFINKIYPVQDLSHVSVFKKSFWERSFAEAGFKINKKILIPGGFYLRDHPFSLATRPLDDDADF